MRAFVLLLMLAACEDNTSETPHDAGASDAAATLRHCVDRPENLILPLNGQLPCELVPPGFGR